VAQDNEINVLSTQLAHQGNAIVLRDSKITDLEATIKLLVERSGAELDRSKARIERFKVQIRKLWRVIIIEGATIVIIVLVLVI